MIIVMVAVVMLMVMMERMMMVWFMIMMIFSGWAMGIQCTAVNSFAINSECAFPLDPWTAYCFSLEACMPIYVDHLCEDVPLQSQSGKLKEGLNCYILP